MDQPDPAVERGGELENDPGFHPGLDRLRVDGDAAVDRADGPVHPDLAVLEGHLRDLGPTPEAWTEVRPMPQKKEAVGSWTSYPGRSTLSSSDP
jgi:hypothetical protein